MTADASPRIVNLSTLLDEIDGEIAQAAQAERAHEVAGAVARATREALERHRTRLLALLAPPPADDAGEG